VFGLALNLVSPVPSALIVNNWKKPFSTRQNTSRWLSGDQRGLFSCSGALVTLTGLEPSALLTKTSRVLMKLV